MRLNKILADAGVASRRGAERLLAEGRVAVNGVVVTAPGAAADPARDTITIDGRELPARTGDVHAYIMLHKPAGVVTTAHDPLGRPTALALVGRGERLFTVGRLDRDTEGLLLLTDDGEWANRVAHPSGGVEKEYEALVDGTPSEYALRRFAEGIALPDGHVAHGTARIVETLDGRALLQLILHEGHKRQARLMFGAIGHPVRRLVRVRVGGLRLGRLASGTWRNLTPAEVAAVTRGAVQGRSARLQADSSPRTGAGVTKGHEGERGGKWQHGRTGVTAVQRRDERSSDDRDRRAGRVGKIDHRPRPSA